MAVIRSTSAEPTSGLRMLVAANLPEGGVFAKGDIVCVTDAALGPRGEKEGPPAYVVVYVTNADMDDVDRYYKTLEKYYDYSIVNQNTEGYRLRVEVDPAVISVNGLNAVLSDRIVPYVQNHPTLVYVSHTDTEVVADRAKPADLPAMKEEFNALFASVSAFSQLYFSESDVDAALGAGGVVSYTKAQIIGKLNDKLDW